MRHSDVVQILLDPRLITASVLAILVLGGMIFYTSTFILLLHESIVGVLNPHFPISWQYADPYFPYVNILLFLSGAVAVVLLSMEYIYIDRYIVFIGLAYVLYFPLAGMNWSTFTSLSVFPVLYLWGFYSYITERRALAGIFFILSAAAFQVYAFPVIFSGIAMLSRDRKQAVFIRENYLGLGLIIIPLYLLVNSAFHTGFMGYYQSINPGSYGVVLNFVNTITQAKPLFFIVLVIPLIAFAFFGPRVLPVSIPYYIFGIIATAAGGSPETLVALLGLVLPFALIGTIRWIGKVEFGIITSETRIIRFALFSLILLNILVVVTYFPFLSILSNLLGL